MTRAEIERQIKKLIIRKYKIMPNQVVFRDEPIKKLTMALTIDRVRELNNVGQDKFEVNVVAKELTEAGTVRTDLLLIDLIYKRNIKHFLGRVRSAKRCYGGYDLNYFTEEQGKIQ